MKLLSAITYDKDDQPIGILETPMYPCIFYAGYITNRNGWVPRSNATSLFHRTIAEAKAAIAAGRIHF